MKNRWRLAGTVIFLLLAASAIWLARPWQAAGPEGDEPAVEESGPEAEVIYAEGRVVPLRQADLAFESNGRLQDALVKEGDEVEAGAPLIRLETRDAEIAVSQAQAALAQAEANLAAAQARLMSAEEGRQTAQLAVQAAEAELAVVQARPREQEIEAAKGAVAEANAGVAQAAGERDVTLERDQAEIAAAEARLEAAEANLFAVRIANERVIQDEDKPDEEREQAQWRLNAAEAEVAAAQAELKRAQAGATEAEERAALNAVGYAAAQRDAAQAQLALAEAGARQEEITIATEKVGQAQSAAEQAGARVSLAETAVRQAEADVGIARARLSAAETALEKLTLRAPFTGTVAYVHLKEGQGATAGRPAVTLADFSEWQVETTDLTERDVAQIAEGQPVQVTVDALPGETISGGIVEIAAAPQGVGVAPQGVGVAPQAAGAPSQAMGEDVTYEVTVALEDIQGLTLRWGMTAFVVVGAEPSEWWSPPPAGGSISVEGETVPARFGELSFQTGGTVAEILVKEGQEVESGDPLIKLEARQQESALAQAQGRVVVAQAALEAAKNQQAVARAEVEIAQRETDVAAAQLALVEAGPRPEELTAAEARLAAARSGVAQAGAARDAQLESVGTEEQIESARAELGSAQADLKALQDRYDTILETCYDTPQGEVCPLYGPVEETTRAQLAAAEARATAAQAALDRLLLGATDAQERAANAAVAAAMARRDQAEAQLALVQGGATPEQIRQVEVALEMAHAQVGMAEAALAEAEAAVTQAEAGVAAAEAGVEAAQEAVERATLRAPFGGRVVRVTTNEGEVVPAGSTVVTVAEVGQWRVETRDLTELDVARLQEGDTVRVSFEALPQAEVEGTVTQIALTPGMDRGDVVYEATVEVHDVGQLPLRWGMTAQISLQR